MPTDGYDYVIVGAGTAGCVLANRLSADPDVKVLLLEAGGKDDWIWIHIPVGYLYCIGNPRTDWCYKTEPEPGLNGRSILYARGQVLGGCSSINAMIYMRGQARDYDDWARYGDRAGAGTTCCRLQASARTTSAAPTRCTARAASGASSGSACAGRSSTRSARRRRRPAFPKIDDFNRGDNAGCGYFQVNQRAACAGTRRKAFLRPAMNRPNLTVMTDAQVTAADARRQARARASSSCAAAQTSASPRARETILAAGAIGSPQILQLSGIGPGALLQQHGHPGRCTSCPASARTCRTTCSCAWRSRCRTSSTLNQRANSLFGKAAMGLEYALFRTGPLTMAPSQLGAFARSDPQQRDARTSSSTSAAVARQVRRPAAPFPGVHRERLQPAADVARARAHQERRPARGTRRSLPTTSRTDEDRKVAVDALRLTRRIAAQPALAHVRAGGIHAGPGRSQTDEELSRPPATSAPRSSIRSAPADGRADDRERRRRCAPARARHRAACAWSTPRSCRRSPPATPIRRP